MTVAASGSTTNGGSYLVLSLPEEKCQLAFLFPKIKNPRYYLKAELGANDIYTQQIEYGIYLTNNISVAEELPKNQTDVWLKRGSPFKNLELVSGVTSNLPAEAERLQGQVELGKDGKEFHITMNLFDDNGVKLSGTFDSYVDAWFLVPYAVIFQQE